MPDPIHPTPEEIQTWRDEWKTSTLPQDRVEALKYSGKMKAQAQTLADRIRALEQFIVGRKRKHCDHGSDEESWVCAKVLDSEFPCECGTDIENAAAKEMVPWMDAQEPDPATQDHIGDWE